MHLPSAVPWTIPRVLDSRNRDGTFDAGSVINITLPDEFPVAEIRPTSALPKTTTSPTETPCFSPTSTIILFLKLETSKPMISATTGSSLSSMFFLYSDTISSFFLDTFIISCCSIILFLRRKTSFPRSFFSSTAVDNAASFLNPFLKKFDV